MTTPHPGSDRDAVHRAVREQLGTHAFGDLPPAERDAVDAHVGSCAECAVELEELRALAARLAASDVDDLVLDDTDDDDPEAGDPSPGGFEAIRARIRAEADPPTVRASAPAADPATVQVTAPTAGPPAVPVSGPIADPPTVRTAAPAVSRSAPEQAAEVIPLRRRRTARVRLAAAAAVIAVVAGGLGSLLGPDAFGTGAGDSITVQALAPGVDARAGVVKHTWGVEVKLTATGFEPGRVYRASVLDATGAPVSAGEFVGTGDAEMRCNLNSSVLAGQATGFVVTDADGAPVLRSGPL